MTRAALREAIPARLRPLLVNAVRKPYARFPKALRRAGYRRLPAGLAGMERHVILNRRVVVKSDAWRSPSPTRSRSVAPAIVLAFAVDGYEGVIAQPRGRCLERFRYPKRIGRLYRRAAKRVEAMGITHDTHEANFALFPDGTVRCIDY